jgi:hypothetical protein
VDISVRRRFAAGVTLAPLACFVPLALAPGAAAALPNPCTLLTKARPQAAFGKGKTLAVGRQKLQKYGTGKFVSESCSETVGAQMVVLSITGQAGGGFGGVKVTSQTHPSGLGSNANLIVGTGLGNGAPVDFITFHRGSIFADITANGAAPITLTAFARTVYRLLA